MKHQGVTVSRKFKTGISRNSKYLIVSGFCRLGHISMVFNNYSPVSFFRILRDKLLIKFHWTYICLNKHPANHVNVW